MYSQSSLFPYLLNVLEPFDQCGLPFQEDEAYAELGEMMDPEDLEYLKKVYKNKLDKKSKKKSSNEDNGDEDEYESKVLERHNRLKEEEQNQKSVKTLLPIRFDIN